MSDADPAVQACPPTGDPGTGTQTIPSRSDLVAGVLPGRPVYSFAWLIDWLSAAGIGAFGPHFRIDPADHELIYRLLIYALRDRDQAAAHGIRLDRGIMLAGPVGCGKTALMLLLARIVQPPHGFVLHSCRDIALDFAVAGFGMLRRYTGAGRTASLRSPRILCFDDLGAESPMSYYGQSCDVMHEILLSRYDRFMADGLITHIATTLSAAQVQDSYGLRLRSRMREMFNLFSFHSQAGDKRK